jgi:hypothetical protein
VIGFFVQDEIRVSPRMSASLGLRYDWQNYFHDDNNLGPRGSFAFAPNADGRTVIRGGAGLFYDRTGPRRTQELIRYNGIRQLRYVITNPGYPDPFAAGQSLATEAPSVMQLAPGIELPMTVQYSLGIERQLAKSTSASVTYTGTRGFHQFLSRDINAPLPPLFAARPDPTRGVVREIESTGKLVGNSVQFTLRGQVSRFVNTSVQYTLSETKNNTAGITWMPPNSYDLSLEYAHADFDQRRRFDLLGTVNPGSWVNLGVALALYSGRPYSLTTGRDDFNTGIANARPPEVPRNSLEGPGYADLDLRWSRDLFFNRTTAAASVLGQGEVLRTAMPARSSSQPRDVIEFPHQPKRPRGYCTRCRRGPREISCRHAGAGITSARARVSGASHFGTATTIPDVMAVAQGWHTPPELTKFKCCAPMCSELRCRSSRLTSLSDLSSRWLEQLNRIAVGVVQLNLFAARTRFHLIAEMEACLLQRVNMTR